MVDVLLVPILYALTWERTMKAYKGMAGRGGGAWRGGSPTLKAVRMQPTEMFLEIVDAQAPKVLPNLWVLGFVSSTRLMTAYQSNIIHNCALVRTITSGAPRIGVTTSPGSFSDKPYAACQDGLSDVMTTTGEGEGPTRLANPSDDCGRGTLQDLHD